MALVDLTTLEVNIPSMDFGRYTTVLSAPPKFGKTEWITEFDRPLILDFEEGTTGKVVFRVQVSKWGEVKKYVSQLVKDPALKEKFKTIGLDTVNYALEACKKWCIDEYIATSGKVITTFNQIPYGGGWEMLCAEFKGEINKLKRAGYGVVIVAHTKDKVFDRDSEMERTKTVPDLTDRERNMVNAMADFLLLGDFEEEVVEPAVKDGNKVISEAIVRTNRVLHLRTNESVEAGFRWKDCPESIPFNFDTFIKVFNNAVTKEIDRGLAKFGLTETKATAIRQELDRKEEEEMEEIIETESLPTLIEQITEVVKAKKKSGVTVECIKDATKDVIGVTNPKSVENVTQAKELLRVLNGLSATAES